MDRLSSDGMRASDQDREHVVAIFCEAYAAGRLDLGELRERAAAAYLARTWGDLRWLAADIPCRPVLLPSPTAMSARPGPGPRNGRRHSWAPLVLVTVATLAMAAATFMPAVGTPLAAVGLIILSVSALFAAGIAATVLISAAVDVERQAGDEGLYRDTM